MHLNSLRSFIQTKQFVSRQELESHNQLIKNEIIDTFESSVKSSNTVLTDKLYEHFKKNFDIIFKENDIQRQQSMALNVEKCGLKFFEYFERELENKLIDSKILEELFKSKEKEIFDSFKKSFGDEEEILFDKDLLSVSYKNIFLSYN